MTEIDTTTAKRSLSRRIARASLYLVPGYPLVRALASARDAVAGGIEVIADQNRRLDERRRNPRRRTYREAMAARPKDALPIAAIEKLCLRRKQAALAMGFIASFFVLGSFWGGTLSGGVLGLLFVSLCAMFVLKHEHQLWQIECGRLRPDEPLAGLGQFMASKGVIARLLNPYLFR